MQLAAYRTRLLKDLSATYDREEAQAIFSRLLEDLLGLQPFIWVREPDYTLDKGQLGLLDQARTGLLQGMPVQQLTGLEYFMGMPLVVNSHVLIPRPETEGLIGLAEELMDASQAGHGRLVDLGTGSGCIALALQRLRPAWEIWGLDISEEALRVARVNARKMQANVHLERFDLLAWKSHRDKLNCRGFDVLVSNPPYIPQGERSSLEVHVREHEPVQALFVPDSDPLIFYRELAEWARSDGASQVYLVAECHTDFASQVRELWSKLEVRVLRIHEDIFGRPRFITGRIDRSQ